MPSCTCSRHKGWLCVASVFAATAFALLLVTGLLLPGTEKGSTVTLISENMPEFVTALVGTGGGAVTTFFVFCRAAWFRDHSADPELFGKKTVRRNTTIGAWITWISMAVSLGLIGLAISGLVTGVLPQAMITAILGLGIAACIPFAIYTLGFCVGSVATRYSDHWMFTDLKKQFLVTEQEEVKKQAGGVSQSTMPFLDFDSYRNNMTSGSARTQAMGAPIPTYAPPPAGAYGDSAHAAGRAVNPSQQTRGATSGAQQQRRDGQSTVTRDQRSMTQESIQRLGGSPVNYKRPDLNALYGTVSQVNTPTNEDSPLHQAGSRKGSDVPYVRRRLAFAEQAFANHE